MSNYKNFLNYKSTRISQVIEGLFTATLRLATRPLVAVRGEKNLGEILRVASTQLKYDSIGSASQCGVESEILGANIRVSSTQLKYGMSRNGTNRAFSCQFVPIRSPNSHVMTTSLPRIVTRYLRILRG